MLMQHYGVYEGVQQNLWGTDTLEDQNTHRIRNECFLIADNRRCELEKKRKTDFQKQQKKKTFTRNHKKSIKIGQKQGTVCDKRFVSCDKILQCLVCALSVHDYGDKDL